MGVTVRRYMIFVGFGVGLRAEMARAELVETPLPSRVEKPVVLSDRTAERMGPAFDVMEKRETTHYYRTSDDTAPSRRERRREGERDTLAGRP